MKTFISVSEARRIVLNTVREQPVRKSPLSEALGCVLARPVVSQDALPPFDNSAMDGFAVRKEDLDDIPTRLEVIEQIPAGSWPNQRIRPGACSRIMTGAPLPRGGDTIIPVEWTELAEDGSVIINRAAKKGAHVRVSGTDVSENETVMAAGAVITPPAVALLTAIGQTTVRVYRRPSVTIITTGDEVVQPDVQPGPGQIRNSNGPALCAHAEQAGARVLKMLHAGDNPAHIGDAVETASEADIILMTGGVSVGDHDYVGDVLAEAGADLHFWKVRQRPGKPLLFGLLSDSLVFGLPGNPTSSAVCFEQYVRPVLLAMSSQDPAPKLKPAILDEAVPKKRGLTTFVRGIAHMGKDGRLHVCSAGSQGSGRILPQVRANCFIHLEEDLDKTVPGEEVSIQWMPWICS